MKAPGLDISLCVAGLFSLTAIFAVYAENPPPNLQELELATGQNDKFAVDDGTITNQVITALNADPIMTSLHIHVNTKNGVVAVKGSVPNAKIGAHLLQLVAAIDGVRGVKNSLRIAVAS